jgi:transcription elongation factor SPT6
MSACEVVKDFRKALFCDQDLADSSDEEEGQNEYDMNDKFLVDDEDEDEEEGEDEGTEEEKKRRRRKKRRESVLDEEDYELIVRSIMPSS